MLASITDVLSNRCMLITPVMLVSYVHASPAGALATAQFV